MELAKLCNRAILTCRHIYTISSKLVCAFNHLYLRTRWQFHVFIRCEFERVCEMSNSVVQALQVSCWNEICPYALLTHARDILNELAPRRTSVCCFRDHVFTVGRG